ncbi:MAG: hypothetical protein OHK0022_19150 [Roseiflexaceae bacterium]
MTQRRRVVCWVVLVALVCQLLLPGHPAQARPSSGSPWPEQPLAQVPPEGSDTAARFPPALAAPRPDLPLPQRWQPRRNPMTLAALRQEVPASSGRHAGAPVDPVQLLPAHARADYQASKQQPATNTPATPLNAPPAPVRNKPAAPVAMVRVGLAAAPQYLFYLPVVRSDPAERTLVLDPGQSGTLRSPDGRVRLDIPAGAVSTTTRFAYRALPSQYAPERQPLAPYFELTAQEAQGRPVTQFARALRLTVSYEPTPGLSEDRLGLYFFREQLGWQPLASTVDPLRRVVIGDTDHFTVFGLLAPESIPVVGQPFPLCAGTELRQGPLLGVHTIVPENNWLVLITGGPRFVGGETWWDSSRRALDLLPASGTGWFSQEQREIACLANEIDPSDGRVGGRAALDERIRKLYRQFGFRRYAPLNGDPVNTAIGNFVHSTTDLEVPGVAGFELRIERTYNNQDERDSRFGVGHSSLLDTNLRLANDGTIDVRYPDGHGTFFKTEGDAFVPGDQGVFDQLAFDGTNFRLTTPEQEVYHFDARGRLTAVSNRYQSTIALTLDGQGRPTTITDSAGRGYALTFEGEHVTAITDPAGRTVQYAYTGNKLTRVIDAGGGKHEYAYDEQGMTSLTDPEQIIYLQNRYDSKGRVVEQIDAGGSHSFFSYGTSETVFTNNRGYATTDRYDGRGRITERVDALGQIERFAYDADDNVTSYTDKAGHTWDATYDARGNLLSSTDPLGYRISYSYNAENDPTSLTDQGGPGDAPRTTSYRYTGGSLTRIDRPDGSAIQASYDARGQLLTLTDPKGGTSLFAYDGQGNLISAANQLGETDRYSYDAVGRMTSRTDAENRITRFAYDPKDNLTRLTDPKGQAVAMTYDGNDNLVRMIDRRGGVYRYEYDANLKLVAETDPMDHTTRYGYDAMYNRISATDPRGNITRYGYDPLDRLVEVVDSQSGRTGYGYDANDNLTHLTNALNHTTTWEYDRLNRVTRQVDALNGVTTWDYDAVGRVVTTTNPRNATTKQSYDLLDRPTQVIDALTGLWQVAYDANGNITTLTDANGHTRRLRYNAADRLIEQTDAGNHVTRMEYDRVGNLTAVTDALGHTTRASYDPNDNLLVLTNALSGTTSLAYDAEDALVALTDANGNTTRFAYDLDGLLVRLTEAGGQVTTFAYDPAHNQTAITNAKGNTWRAEYDTLNRRVRQTDPLGHPTGYAYDALGRLVGTTDANGITTGYGYDPLDRLTSVVQNQRPGQPANHQTNVVTSYQYDPAGNLTAITDANGETTRFAYDLLDRVTSEVNPLGRVWHYGYDPVGNLIERIDANGQTTRYRYDADDLLTAQEYSDGTRVRFEYDPVHNQTAMIDALGRTSNQYDALGRLTASVNHQGQRVGYSYDPVGNRTAMTYPDGRTLRFAYDPTNFAVRVTDPDGNVFVATRDATHNVVRVDNPNATHAEYDIDAAERLTGLRNQTSANPHETISSFAYTLDPVGNRTQVQGVYRWRKPTALTEDYRYDPLYRLTGVTGSDGHQTSYGYDAVGNRLRLDTNDDPTLKRAIDRETTSATYDAANQLVASVRAVEPRGNPDRAGQTAQVLRAFAHEVAAQRGRHIAPATADALLDQAATLASSLEGTSPPNTNATTTELAALRAAVESAGADGQIDRAGIANSLLAKLGHAEDANARRGPELFVTLYDYDRNGNRVRRTAPNEDTANERDRLKTEYRYDIENRLLQTQDFRSPDSANWLPGDETRLTYDGYGRLFRRAHDQHIGGGGLKWVDYVYDGLEPIAEYVEPNPQYINYYRGLGHILSMHEFKSQQSPAGTLYYYHYDGLDSVSALTKHQGQSVHNYRYNAYGIPVDVNGKAADASNFTDPHNHYSYTGQEWDEQTRLLHFYARQYDPHAAVWLQQDPYRGRLPEPKTLHRYGYVGGNPTTFVDWLGYDTRSKSGGQAGVGCGVNKSCVTKTGCSLNKNCLLAKKTLIGCGFNMTCATSGKLPLKGLFIDDTKWFMREINKHNFIVNALMLIKPESAYLYVGAMSFPFSFWDHKKYRYGNYSHFNDSHKSVYINGRLMDTAGPANIQFGMNMKTLGLTEKQAVMISDADQGLKVIGKIGKSILTMKSSDAMDAINEGFKTWNNWRTTGHLDHKDDLEEVIMGYRGTIFDKQ